MDLAIVWGPLAGYFAKKISRQISNSRRLNLKSIRRACRSPSQSRWAFAKGNIALRDELEKILVEASIRDPRHSG